MDLIAGFTEFFEFYEAQEYNQAWGATLPYEQNSSHNAVDLFEKHYNILYDGLKGSVQLILAVDILKISHLV